LRLLSINITDEFVSASLFWFGLVWFQCKHILAAMILDVIDDSQCPTVTVAESAFVQIASSFIDSP